jgi:hypothetical protein
MDAGKMLSYQHSLINTLKSNLFYALSKLISVGTQTSVMGEMCLAVLTEVHRDFP